MAKQVALRRRQDQDKKFGPPKDVLEDRNEGMSKLYLF